LKFFGIGLIGQEDRPGFIVVKKGLVVKFLERTKHTAVFYVVAVDHGIEIGEIPVIAVIHKNGAREHIVLIYVPMQIKIIIGRLCERVIYKC